MEDISLHILDIAENSIRAGAKNIKIAITEDLKNDLLTVEITDDGEGMSEDELKKALDPFFTTKKGKRVGLGLPLLKEAAEEADGDMVIMSEKGKGTTIKATFKHSHIDRKPLGDITSTIKMLIVSNPNIDFVFVHTKNGSTFKIDTREE